MIEAEQLTHHEQTLRFWEAVGETRIATRPNEIEQRKRPRFLVSGAVCQLDVSGPNGDESIKVSIRDVCRGGACLLSPTPLPVRQPVRLHPPATVHAELEAVEGCVISCRERADHCRIGVRFDYS
jgi:hypothetical protein